MAHGGKPPGACASRQRTPSGIGVRHSEICGECPAAAKYSGVAAGSASSQVAAWHPIVRYSRGARMLDLFYVGVVVGFFVLLWCFTKFSEHM